MKEAKQRKVHSAEFKAKVGLEALRGMKTVNEIGQEYGSKLEIGLTRHLSALLGYSYFNAGGFIKETSSSAQEDIEFSHASLTYTF